MSFSNITKKLHDALLEDEPSKPTAVKSPAVPPAPPAFNFTLTPAAPMSTAPSPFAVPGSVVVDEVVYKRILDKTNFDQTDVGKTIHRYFDALEGTGLDTNTRFKSAIRQAAALDGITPDRVLAAFDSLKTALSAETDKFGKAVDGQNQKEVISRQQQLQQISDQIAQLTQQIADLQTQHTQVSAELGDAQAKVGNAQTQFQFATQRRSNEIDQQKAQFSALLN